MSDIVAAYAKAGFCLFPLVGKRPAQKDVDWTKTPYDPNADHEKIQGNFGVLVGPEYLIIDVDVKNGAKGKESYEQLNLEAKLTNGWEKTTFVVRTGSGGFHVYLKKPADFKVSKNVKKYPGIEFLSGNAYVVGAGSIHPDTHLSYDAVSQSPNGIATAPATILEIVKATPVEHRIDQEAVVDDDPINIERYINLLANLPEAQEGQRDNSIYIASCRGRDLGLSLPVCLSTVLMHYNATKLNPPLDPGEVEKTVQNVYRYAQGQLGNKNVSAIFQTVEVGDKIDIGEIKYDRTERGGIQKTLNNAVNYLVTLPHLSKTFRYNQFTGMVEIDQHAPWFKERGEKGPNVTDDDIKLLKFHIAKTVRIEFSVNLLWEAVTVVAHKKHYHPVRNYLTALKWDGKPRLNTWLSTYAGSHNTEYTRAVGRKVLCAAVKRIFEPGCKWDYVLILEGAQGIGKSTLCRILGRMWTGDMNLDPHAKDSVAMMLGKWIIELSEMVALKWADANALKSFITRDKDTVRLAYDRHAKDFPRQSIFIGTVNPEHMGYLHDVTGNRRFWIVSVHAPLRLIELEQDCDQLWAETVAVYKKEQLYLTGEAANVQIVEAEARMPEDPWRVGFVKWLQENPEVDFVTPIMLLEYMGYPLKNVTKGEISRMAHLISGFGWDKQRRNGPGGHEICYVRPIKERVSREVSSIIE